MSILKTTCYALTAAAVLAIAPSSFANTSKTAAVSGTTFNAEHYGYGNSEYTSKHAPVYILGSSETASHFYKKGIRQFEKGNFEKSEQAFKAVIRADGSKTMDRMTLHYLTLIKHKQGDSHAAKKYSEAYFALGKK